jgi:carbonic anhydrase/acetyltransferase-like protein (isoleucine patch superfamily)
MKNIRAYQGTIPQIASSAYIDNSAVIIGKVIIGANTSIWCNVVARGDVSHIQIGENSNIQDLTMLHVTHNNPGFSPETPLLIGNFVTVGHSCCLHACTLADYSFVGMGTTILDRAYIEPYVMIGAGSLVPQGKKLESGFLYFGNPAQKIRPLSTIEKQQIEYSAQNYVRLSRNYL